MLVVVDTTQSSIKLPYWSKSNEDQSSYGMVLSCDSAYSVSTVRKKKVNTNVAQTENAGCTMHTLVGHVFQILYFTTSHIYIQRHKCLLWTF